MTSVELLANVRVASPCTARWADMTGNERARFCAQCQKHVYNLSEMTAEAASSLIREKEGKLCVRFYQRADGTVLTADCPVGAAAVVRRVKRLIAVGVGVLVPAFAAPLWYHSPGPNRSKLYQTWETTLLAIKSWLNPPPPPSPFPPVMGTTPPPLAPPGPPPPGPILMGKICPQPPIAPSPVPPPNLK